MTASAGRLIGVNTAIVAPSGASAGVGFAVPADIVERIVPALIRTGKAPIAGIGVVAVPDETTLRAGIIGVVVHTGRKGSSGEEAGIMGLDDHGQLGDIIVAVAGNPVNSIANLSAALEEVGVGNRTTVTIVREGRRRNVDVLIQDIS